MPHVEEICTITARGQTTVPKAVRRALGVAAGGRIAFRVQDGEVTVHALPHTAADPALAPFLALLETDMLRRAPAIQPLSEQLLARMQSGLDGHAAEPNDPIDGETAL